MIPIRSRRHLRRLFFASPVPALFLPFIAWRSESLAGWTLCLGLLGLISASGWILNERWRRAIANTPASRIGSAPQGYVELAGQAGYAGDPVYSPVTGLPCVWYRCLTERIDSDDRNRHHHVSEQESSASILLDDGSGEVLIDPEGAQIETGGESVTTRGDYRYTEWLILPGQKLFALGEFSSVRGDGDLDLRRDVSLRLAEMKRDQAELLRRFDQNGDGRIDPDEWEFARRTAEAEVFAEHRTERSRPATHTLRRPSAGRLFLVTTRDPAERLLHFRLWRWYHLAVLTGSLHGLWLIQRDPSLVGL